MSNRSFGSRVRRAWNAFRQQDPIRVPHVNVGEHSSTMRPDRPILSRNTQRNIVSSIYTRIALDISTLNFKHIKLNEYGRYDKDYASELQNCLSIEANNDQSGRELIFDAALSLFDEGSVAIIPVDTDRSPEAFNSYDVESLRTGKILEWFPRTVRVNVYNENRGIREDIILDKSAVAIVENPLYSIMNAPNSTLQRLIKKMNLLDTLDEKQSAGKLDLIIQLPYVIKSDARRQQAEQRRKDIEMQLTGSKYGIAYTDGTERITQLNRPAENTLVEQVENLTSMLYSQLGLSEAILKGSATEEEFANYYARTIDPIATAISEAMVRKFLTKTARTQGQTIRHFRDPFLHIPTSKLAELSDKLTRNEIASTNEIRNVLGWLPDPSPEADELKNKNIKDSGDSPVPEEPETPDEEEEEREV